MAKLSIITINLNNAKGLNATIESVISQRSKDFEYIIIDGGSTDGSVDVVKSYTNMAPSVYQPPTTNHESRISYWASELDSGIYNAMNKGIKVAKGEYCQFLNSGDTLFDPTVIDNMLIDLPEDCAIIYGNMLKAFKNQKSKDFRKSNLKKNLAVRSDVDLFDMFTGTLNQPATFNKKELFNKYGLFDENLKIVSDWKFYLQCVYNCEKIYYKNIYVTFFDVNGISLTNLELRNQEREKVLKEFFPISVYKVLNKYKLDLRQLNRIKKYRVIYKFFYLVERVLFKFEKFKICKLS